MLNRKPPHREPKPDRSAEFASFTPPRAKAVMASNLSEQVRPVARASVAIPKTPGRKDQRIRDSAKGERCLMRLPGCPDNPEMTIWSHARYGRAGKGMGIKSLDLCGCYACTYCDAIFDGQRRSPGLTVSAIELAWHQAHLESLVRLRQKGLA